MTLFNFLLLNIVLAVSIYLSYLNPFEVTIRFANHIYFQIPFIVLALCSMLLGALLLSLSLFYKNSGLFRDKITRMLKDKKWKWSEEIFNKGYCLYLGGKKQEAARMFEKVMAKDPNHIRTILFLGNIKREDGNFIEAIKYHLQGRRLKPRDLDILYTLIEDFDAYDKLSDSLVIIKEIRAIDRRSPKPLEKIRGIFVKREQWDKAIEAQRDLLPLLKGTEREEKEKNRLASLQYRSGLAHIKKKELEKGIEMMKGAIRTEPQCVPAYVALGKTYISMEKPKEAVNTWEKGYKATKAFVIIKRVVDLYQLGGDDAAAFDAYQWAISVNPEASYLHLMLGELYVRKAKPDEGVKELEEARSRLSSKASLHLILAMAYETLGKKDESFQEYHLGFKAGTKDLISYVCTTCTNSQQEWKDKCPSCGEFNTLKDHCS